MIMKQAIEKNFDELLSKEKPLMVDFGAEWCGPCKALAPMVAELAETYKETGGYRRMRRGREQQYSRKVFHSEHTDGDFLQGRQGGRAASRRHCQVRTGGEIESVAVKKRECPPRRHSLFSLFLHFFKSYF